MDFPPTRGGIQTMAREIIARAQRTAFEVIAPTHPNADDVPLGVPVYRVGPIALGRRAVIPALAIATRRHITAHRPDVVLSLHANSAIGALGGPPLVLVTHGGELRSRKIRQVARFCFPRAERIIANSRFTRSEAVALGADPMRTEVLPVGAPDPVPVDPDATKALRARFGGERIVLSVARLTQHKGHDRLISALAALPEDVHAVIVGVGPARTTLEELTVSLGLTRRVTFVGEVTDEELATYYSAADAFALLSRETSGSDAGVEGGGIALLEACAYGLPVVAGATGGIPETIHDGETGLLVDPEDHSMIVRGISRVLTDRALAERLGTAARRYATGERSWDRFVARLEDALARAARSERGGPA
jgi:phosphatidyl-myo-inositol dimannoside synthase